MRATNKLCHVRVDVVRLEEIADAVAAAAVMGVVAS